MVKGLKTRQHDRNRILRSQTDQHRLRLNPQLMQHRKQQQRLCLAIAITQLPGFIGRLRVIIAEAKAVIKIADLVLHKA